MNVALRPVEEQVIVITGATSGIGLATARMAADRGASVVLAARSEEALTELVDEITASGGEAVAVVADVRDREDVHEIAEVARQEYDGFDTWVNVAGAFIYGRLLDTPVEDMREQFDVNVWGLLYGSLEAAEELRERGGAVINVGSVASDRAIPLQGSYSASKHAVKGFTDALRMELQEENAPVSVTLVKPGSIGTPYPEHAKNYMEESAELPPPLYAPETVARAILDAAENPRRDVTVGGGGKLLSLLGRFVPGLGDRIIERSFFDQQRGDRPPDAAGQSIVDESVGDLEERGDHDRHISETSLYTRASRDPRIPAAILAGAATIAGLLFARSRRSRSEEGEKERSGAPGSGRSSRVKRRSSASDGDAGSEKKGRRISLGRD